MLVGLHACGDLSPTLLRCFAEGAADDDAVAAMMLECSTAAKQADVLVAYLPCASMGSALELQARHGQGSGQQRNGC